MVLQILKIQFLCYHGLNLKNFLLFKMISQKVGLKVSQFKLFNRCVRLDYSTTTTTFNNFYVNLLLKWFWTNKFQKLCKSPKNHTVPHNKCRTRLTLKLTKLFTNKILKVYLATFFREIIKMYLIFCCKEF